MTEVVQAGHPIRDTKAGATSFIFALATRAVVVARDLPLKGRDLVNSSSGFRSYRDV